MHANVFDRLGFPLLIGFLIGVAAVAAGIAAGGSPAEQAELAARWTARAALPMFLVTYLASSLYRLNPTDTTRGILRRRRQWGLGFALTHTIHLAALLVNILVFAPRTFASLIPGGFAYVMIYIMALTSNDASVRALGKNWKRLHSFGIHYIWLIYTAAYSTRIFKPETMTAGLAFAPLLFAALGLRLYVRFGRGRSASSPPVFQSE